MSPAFMYSRKLATVRAGLKSSMKYPESPPCWWSGQNESAIRFLDQVTVTLVSADRLPTANSERLKPGQLIVGIESDV